MRFIILSLMLICGLSAALAAEVSGTVRSKSGKPLAGVTVLSHCRRFLGETDSNGFYKLIGTGLPGCGNVIYFSLQGYRPLLKIVDITTTEVDVVMDEMPNADWKIPACSGSGKRIGWYLYIPVPKGASLRKSRSIHGTSYEMRLLNNGKYVLLYGTGSVRAKGFPEDRWLLDAKEFTVRAWGFGDAEGIDVRGQSNNGTYWRFFGTFANEFTYSGVTQETAKFLDTIMDGACIKP
jgi:hypothetical protein